jgi:DNA-directed RNA polymerase subunit beta'
MGLITNNERYNQIIDIWTRVDTRITETLMKEISTAQTRFQLRVYMMLDSGARGSKQQIKQLRWYSWIDG